MTGHVRDVSDLTRDDVVAPFTVEPLSTRGRVVRLGSAVDLILKRHNYPDAVSRVLGEAIALTLLLGATLKTEGRFQLQTKSEGPIGMIVVDFDAPSSVRAMARYDSDRLATHHGDLLGVGYLAFTVDPGGEGARRQGIVALDGRGLQAGAHEYFAQSEQIPTLVRLAVGQNVDSKGTQWRAGGLLVQYLPHSELRLRAAAESEGHEATSDDGDAWVEAKSLAATTEDHELLDPQLSTERLLYRLFNERGVRVAETTEVRDVCRCSAERVDGMLRAFSADDRAAMVGDDGKISVTCEFCSVRRVFDPVDYSQ